MADGAQPTMASPYALCCRKTIYEDQKTIRITCCTNNIVMLLSSIITHSAQGGVGNDI
jgi:hypothetical protein